MNLSPGSAILLNAFVPGAAHVQLGQPVRALLAFATSVGLFFAGWAIVGHHLWYMRLFDPFALIEPVVEHLPINILPELPNLGCLIVASFLRPEVDPEYLRLIRAPVAGEDLGLLLCGMSGMVNALWCVDAHALARGAKSQTPSPASCAFVSWLLPGAGHAMAGQRDKGSLIGGAVVVMFVLGLLLSAGHGVDRSLQPAWWIPSVLFGGGVTAAQLLTAPLRMVEQPPAMFEIGLAMCAVAGLMNLVVMIDAYTIAERKAGGEPAP